MDSGWLGRFLPTIDIEGDHLADDDAPAGHGPVPAPIPLPVEPGA